MSLKFIGGNWKMNNDLTEGVQLVNQFIELIKNENHADLKIVLFVPYLHLVTVQPLLGHIGLGAQDVSAHESGAFTGEISAKMLKSAGVTHCLVGHSERRLYHGETNSAVAKKIDRLLEQGISPVVCIGETLQQRNQNLQKDIIAQQLTECLFHLNERQVSQTVVAYEPVWAIGTGQTATPDQAQEIHAHLRKLLVSKFGVTIGEELLLIYGGSCNPSNASQLFKLADINGGLIGGASLVASQLMQICNAI